MSQGFFDPGELFRGLKPGSCVAEVSELKLPPSKQGKKRSTKIFVDSTNIFVVVSGHGYYGKPKTNFV